MQRVNGHHFYDLALKLYPLRSVKPDTPVKDVFFALWDGRIAIRELFSQIPLRVCKPHAQGVVNSIDALIPRNWDEAISKFSEETLIGPIAYGLVNGVVEFETVLAAELQSLDTYLVSQKGTHSTPDLIDRAEIMFHDKIRHRLPENAILDIRNAGRCLALDNPTASAFHILRAVESVMSVYFERVTGKPIPTRMRNWGIYLKTLRKYPQHSQKAIGFLDHIRDTYRNPILHPEVIVSEDEAESLLGAAASAIRMLVLETEALEQKPLDLPFEIPGELPPAVA
jgi:hypothetical protein